MILFPSLISKNVSYQSWKYYYHAHTFWAMQNALFNVKCNIAILLPNYYHYLKGFSWLPLQTLIILLKSLRSPPSVSHWDNNDVKMVIKILNQVKLKFKSFEEVWV